MSDFINGLGGLNRILKLDTAAKTSSAAPASGQSLLSQGGGVDSFTRTSNPLGITQSGSAASAVKNLQGKSIEELTQGWNPTTVATLRKAPQQFPPIEGFDA